ncbi:hypothetical protein ACWDS7_00005, partial [Streptosporangium sp. NPDC003464]
MDTLVDTGLRPLDGARHLRDVAGADERLCRLVAHHSWAVDEASERDLHDALTKEFAPERRDEPGDVAQDLVQAFPEPGLVPLVQPTPAGHAEPYPSSGGRCSRAMPVCSMDRMPCDARRSSSRLRPGGR